MITSQAHAHGHAYTMGNINAYCVKCSDKRGLTVLTCDYDTATPRYYALPATAYADDPASYTEHANRASVESELHPTFSAVLHVFDGSREPWNEQDPYPDYVARYGARGGVRWERA